MAENLINKVHNSNSLGAIFHTLNYCLQRELKDCKSVLDLGCGYSSPIQYCKNVEYSLGVEVFKPYLEISKEKGIHNKYLVKKIEELDFTENSFDAVIMIEVLEHLPEKTGLEILKKMENWARKKIIISSPNGFMSQKEIDNNPLQKHLSGWDNKKMKKLGFKTRGLAGLKFLRQEVQNNTMSNDLVSSICFRPKMFWFGIATMSQLITYFIPEIAFELFSVKRINAYQNRH